MASLGGPWDPFGALLPLGALLAALGAVLGPLGPLLGPPEPLLGLMLASRGALFGVVWGICLNALGKIRKPRFLLTVQHFLRFFQPPGGPEAISSCKTHGFF